MGRVQGLPAYNVLLFAARPVALLIDDCSKIDAIVDSVSAKVGFPLLINCSEPACVTLMQCMSCNI